MEQLSFERHPWRKAAITVGGGFLLFAGVIMLVTPGPGLLTLAAGLALLSKAYRWPRRLLRAVRERIRNEKEPKK
jgi:UPF0716 family protein affecting phage T7 exclusion